MSRVALHRVRHGLLCHDENDTVIGAALIRYGEWAEEEIFLLSHAVCTGDTVLDIGANVGTHTLAFTRLVGDTGQVLSFDGQRRAFQLLGMNAILNRLGNARCFNVLVGASPRLRFAPEPRPMADGNLGSISFAQVAELNGAGPDLVPLATITVDSLDLDRCDLIKIDVEGMELDVLLGAVGTIRRCRPVVYFEQTGPVGLAEAASLLRDFGYQLFWHAAHPFNANNFNRYALNIFGPTREVNILGVPPARPLLAELARSFGLRPVENSYLSPSEPPAEAGWVLPEAAYAALQAPFSHAAGLRSFDDILPGIAEWGHSEPAFLARLQADFRNLVNDRRKAQEIMEYLSGQVAAMSAELVSLRQASQVVRA